MLKNGEIAFTLAFTDFYSLYAAIFSDIFILFAINAINAIFQNESRESFINQRVSGFWFIAVASQ